MNFSTSTVIMAEYGACSYSSFSILPGVSHPTTPKGNPPDQNDRRRQPFRRWDGESYAQHDLTKGFCIKGEDTAAFLEDTLDKLGLTRREANEFIVYWLPLMEQNPYNIISFQTDIYTDAAELLIDPAPDTLIRVFMTWSAADAFVELPEQYLTAPERTGFTVVEWGGTKIE